MVRKQLYLTPEQDAQLKQLARQSGKTEAEVMRKALESYVSGEETVVDKLQAAGLLAQPSQPAMAARQADELYARYLRSQEQHPALGLAETVLAERREP